MFPKLLVNVIAGVLFHMPRVLDRPNSIRTMSGIQESCSSLSSLGGGLRTIILDMVRSPWYNVGIVRLGNGYSSWLVYLDEFESLSSSLLVSWMVKLVTICLHNFNSVSSGLVLDR